MSRFRGPSPTNDRTDAKGLHVLSAGAAQGLVETLAPQFLAQTGIALHSTFGAVGAIREKLLSRTIDALILTEAMIKELITRGYVLSGTSRAGPGAHRHRYSFGRRVPDITTRAALERTLCVATDIFLPDIQRSTAGMHFARVLEQLGIRGEISQRLRPYPNGAAAMRELAHSIGSTPIGCTQVSEI